MATDRTLGKSMAKSAAIGAVIAIPVPFVGPILGAAAGAGYAWYKAKKRGLEPNGVRVSALVRGQGAGGGVDSLPQILIGPGRSWPEARRSSWTRRPWSGCRQILRRLLH